MEAKLHGITGGIVLFSLAMAFFIDVKWLVLTALAGLDLFQSAFTNWSPIMVMLKKIEK